MLAMRHCPAEGVIHYLTVSAAVVGLGNSILRVDEILRAPSFVADEKTDDDDDIVPYEAYPLDSVAVRSVSYNNLAAFRRIKRREVHSGMVTCRKTLFAALHISLKLVPERLRWIRLNKMGSQEAAS